MGFFLIVKRAPKSTKQTNKKPTTSSHKQIKINMKNQINTKLKLISS